MGGHVYTEWDAGELGGHIYTEWDAGEAKAE